MADEYYAKTVLVRNNDKSILLERVSVTGDSADYNEAFIQDMEFINPNCLSVGIKIRN